MNEWHVNMHVLKICVLNFQIINATLWYNVEI